MKNITRVFDSLFRDHWTIPKTKKIENTIRSFGATEKVIFYCLVAIFIMAGVTLLYRVNNQFLVEVPGFGGTYTDGVIGTPRFINPILAVSEVDKDLSSLIYSGLMKQNPDGSLTTDLADSYTVSDDGLVYTFVLNPKAIFHDQEKVTPEDIIYTIHKATDPQIKSPKRSNFIDVAVEKIDEKTMTFTLKQPHATFLRDLTLGILPKQIWKNVSNDNFQFSQNNVKPIGSGPYKIENVSQNSAGLPTEFELGAFSENLSGKPYISTLVFKSFANENDLLSAYRKNPKMSIQGFAPTSLATLDTTNSVVESTTLPRIFGVFFNQNKAPVFTRSEVRSALDIALNKESIVKSVLAGYGKPLNGPLPTDIDVSTSSDSEHITLASKLLESKGWKKNGNGIYEFTSKDKKDSTLLSFSITTSDIPELRTTAEMIQKTWQTLGAVVELKVFESSDLNQNIIRPRKYDTLLFGEVIGRDYDLYPFWHSSARNDPGLNIAMYTSTKADKLLENGRNLTAKAKSDNLALIEKEIITDDPATFIYAPSFIFIVPKDIQNIKLGEINNPSDRFIGIEKWYITKDKVWSIFTNPQ